MNPTDRNRHALGQEADTRNLFGSPTSRAGLRSQDRKAEVWSSLQVAGVLLKHIQGYSNLTASGQEVSAKITTVGPGPNGFAEVGELKFKDQQNISATYTNTNIVRFNKPQQKSLPNVIYSLVLYITYIIFYHVLH